MLSPAVLTRTSPYFRLAFPVFPVSAPHSFVLRICNPLPQGYLSYSESLETQIPRSCVSRPLADLGISGIQAMDHELRESQAIPREPLPPLLEAQKSVVESLDAPPDGGWHAWVQVLSASFLIFNSWYATSEAIPQSANVRHQRGIVNSFGAYQAFYQSDLLSSYSSSAISWIGTIQAFLLVLVGVISGPVYDRGHGRLLIAGGTLFIFLGMLMTSFATEYPQLLLAQGVLVGLGFGCLYVPSVAIAASYFSTRRALALGLTSTGGSVSE